MVGWSIPKLIFLTYPPLSTAPRGAVPRVDGRTVVARVLRDGLGQELRVAVMLSRLSTGVGRV